MRIPKLKCVEGVEMSTVKEEHEVLIPRSRRELKAVNGLFFIKKILFLSYFVVIFPLLADNTYLVIDLSQGPTASSYQVSYLDSVPDGGWSDEYKTTKLVLRKIDAGAFICGIMENGWIAGVTPHRVTLSRPFYIGVFEVTQRQWELVMGTRPSYFSNEEWYASRPVESVTYDMIRGGMLGSQWPASDKVDESSFIGRLRSTTGIDFDLPTEAQWEYAGQAGTTMILYNIPAASGTAAVGSYEPNEWGIYDIHGNVFELCLDWYGSLSFTDAVEDPKGPESGSGRVARGGCWSDGVDFFNRHPDTVFDYRDNRIGFRLCGSATDDMSSKCRTISYNPNGGSCAIVSQKVIEDGKLVSLPLPARASYSFLGWFTSKTGGTVIYDGMGLEADVTAYAHWKEKTSEDLLFSYVRSGSGIAITGIQGEVPVNLSIPSVYDGKTVVSIGSRAFSHSSGLKTITIPSSVTNIADSAFLGCGALTKISVASESKHFKTIDRFLLNASVTDLLISWGSGDVSVPQGVTRIRDNAFYGRSGLTSVTLPNTVLTIGDNAFWDCVDLKRVKIPTSVTSVGAAAFWQCSELESLTIPASVTSIGDYAFSYCVALRQVYVDSGDATRIKELMESSGFNTSNVTFIENGVQPVDVPTLVPGAKVDFDTGLVGYTPKNLPSGLKYDKNTGRITGTPTKPTGDAGVTVTFTKKGAETQMLQFVVSAIPTINVTLEGDTEKCKVTGANKAYLVGKKVSLSATAPKGTAFVGWFKDGEPWPSAEESVKPKLSFVMTPENLELVAKFEKEKMSLACLGLAAGTFTVGVDGTGDGIPLEITTQSGVKSVKATKLPTGMKLVKDKTTGEWMITGAPTKAGSFNVVLTVTAVSGAVQSITIPVTVEALPSWLVGTYTGMVGRGEGKNWMAYGTFSLTVAATGKISAKVVVPSGSYSFTATRWDEYLEDAFAVQMKTKNGETLSLIVDGTLPWYEARISDTEHGNMFTIPNVEPFRVVAWRNEFGKDGEIAKDPSASDFISKIIALKNVALRVTGSKIEGYNLSLLDSNDRTADLKLTFDAKGNVKYKGKVDGVLISGKTVLLIDGSDYYTILDLVVPIKKAEVMYFVFGFARDELHNPEYDFEIIRMDYQ